MAAIRRDSFVGYVQRTVNSEFCIKAESQISGYVFAAMQIGVIIRQITYL